MVRIQPTKKWTSNLRIPPTAEAVKTLKSIADTTQETENRRLEGGKALRAPALGEFQWFASERGRAKPCPLPTCEFPNVK